jgi:hypothetical protein
MLLTPGATSEPARPPLKVGIYFWHLRAWDIHFWRGDHGVPTVALRNPNDTG